MKCVISDCHSNKLLSVNMLQSRKLRNKSRTSWWSLAYNKEWLSPESACNKQDSCISIPSLALLSTGSIQRRKMKIG
jgi:hypothetical protein